MVGDCLTVRRQPSIQVERSHPRPPFFEGMGKMKIQLTQDIKTDRDKRTVSYWVARWYDGTGRRRSKSLGRTDKLTKREAKKLALMMETDFDRQPGRRNAQRMRLKDFLDTYFNLRKNELAKASLSRYKDTGRYLLHYFGEGRQIDSITPQDAARFKAALSAGKLANATQSRRDVNGTSVILHIRNSKAIFNYGKKIMGALVNNPFEALSGQVKTSTQWHYITMKEFNALMEHATSNFKAMIALCRLAGLRRMEAYYLEWQDVNFDKGRIYICGKNHWKPKDKESRTIPLCPELAQILLECFQDAPEGQVRVCPETNPQNIDRGIVGTIKRAGLTKWLKPLHSLRKSCITDWAERYPIHAVMQWSGHSDISTTQRYYTQVGDGIYDQAASLSFWSNKTEKAPENKKTETPVE